jgi:ubiquinone/menaquinone biosynthesis C-methylase UbiE
MIVEAKNCPPIEAEKIFLEVGCAYGSVPHCGDYEFSEDELYIGINIRADRLKYAEEDLARRSNATLRHEPLLIHGDATNLPPQIKDRSVDTVYFGNVFGDPQIDMDHIQALHRVRRELAYTAGEPKTAHGPIKPRELITLPAMVRQAHRVIKDSGRLVVVETLSPFMDGLMGEFMEDSGFAIDVHVHNNDEETKLWQELVRPFKALEAKRQPAGEDRRDLPDDYIMIARKVVASQL